MKTFEPNYKNLISQRIYTWECFSFKKKNVAWSNVTEEFEGKKKQTLNPKFISPFTFKKKHLHQRLILKIIFSIMPSNRVILLNKFLKNKMIFSSIREVAKSFYRTNDKCRSKHYKITYGQKKYFSFYERWYIVSPFHTLFPLRIVFEKRTKFVM